MPQYGYESPGGAFTNAIDEFMVRREAQKHQALLDKLAQSREDRLVKAQLESDQEHRDALREKREKDAEQAHEKELGDLEKRVGGMVPGDIPDREMLQQAEKLKVAGQYFPKPAESMPGVAAVPVGQVRLGVQQPSEPSVRPYIGTPKERADVQSKTGLETYIKSLPPNSPQRQVAEAKLHGVNLTAQDIKLENPQATLEPVMTREAALAAGKVPQGTKIIEPLQPKDTSARDQAKQAHLDSEHEKATKEFNDLAKPTELQIYALNNLGASLSERSAKADALLVPELLKATIAGAGVRITQPEINSELGGSRSYWDSATLKFNAWLSQAPDPKTGQKPNLVLNDNERDAIRSLAKVLRRKANAMHKKMMDARDAFDDADNPDTLRRLRSKYRRELFEEDEPSDTNISTAPATAKPSAKDLIDQYDKAHK